MSMFGTIRKNKPELSEGMPNKEFHSPFYSAEDTAVRKLHPKQEKNAILMNTLHRGKEKWNTSDKKNNTDLRL
ncbi:hypothetical protein TNCT_153171 [Trichonephila clavata]|uniref:Uncharacterized protein n=1 Tax=Trichonephila clavata TaxID=2740835 RepID=A0A8X6KY26_TRICU|nr:hypothetical protein TNCT_153171 [Trichonephila clavata]